MTRSTGQLTCLLQSTNWLAAIFVIACVFLYECGREKSLTCVYMYLHYMSLVSVFEANVHVHFDAWHVLTYLPVLV